MKEIDSELSTPPDIIRTWKTLAPQGTTVDCSIVAMNIAVELHRAQAERSTEGAELKKLDRLYS